MAGTDTDLICAIATPPGEGGVGIIRLSGKNAKALAQKLVSIELKPRRAHHSQFIFDSRLLDDGIILWFPGPNSFTGEDVVELQGHGGPVILQNLLRVLCDNGARLARPGEFSERAFLNGKMDLVQAEAIADLISAKSETAAKAAMASLQGAFSQQVSSLANRLLQTRVEIEAAIDFPDEDIEILEHANVAGKLGELITDCTSLLNQAEQGRRLCQGITVALIGEPNVGKSSLLNALAGEEAAIVTDVPGTTRDLLKIDIVIDGMPLRLVDTAGLRQTEDEVERIGVARARQQVADADYIALVTTPSALGAFQQAATKAQEELALMEFFQRTLGEVGGLNGLEEPSVFSKKLHIVVNKVDLGCSVEPFLLSAPVSLVSAKTGEGLAKLASKLAGSGGQDHDSTVFTARTRHVQALKKTCSLLQQAQSALHDRAGTELVADDCLLAHQTLGEIVGTMTPDDLLGEIFSTFCIGK